MIKIDLQNRVVSEERGGREIAYPMASAEAFSLVSEAWVQCGWDAKYVYTFSWLGRPIIQLPEDMLRIQEVIYRVKPDVILETGIAHGGSLVYYASILKAMERGRVIGVDVDIRPHNLRAINEHPLSPMITTIEGSSIDPGIIASVKAMIRPEEIVLVMLDSNHTKAHVEAELEAYSELVSVGSYIIAADGIMRDVVGAPRTKTDWTTNNPRSAADAFLSSHPEFARETPQWPFDESIGIRDDVTYWRGGWLRRLR